MADFICCPGAGTGAGAVIRWSTGQRAGAVDARGSRMLRHWQQDVECRTRAGKGGTDGKEEDDRETQWRNELPSYTQSMSDMFWLPTRRVLLPAIRSPQPSAAAVQTRLRHPCLPGTGYPRHTSPETGDPSKPNLHSNTSVLV